MEPAASGVPAVGLAVTPLNVSVPALPLELAVTVQVIAVAVWAVTEAVRPEVPPHAGDPAASNVKPAGAVSTTVPAPIRPGALSLRTGPVSAVYAPPVVSAEIDPPPEAGVTVTPVAVNGQAAPFALESPAPPTIAVDASAES